MRLRGARRPTKREVRESTEAYLRFCSAATGKALPAEVEERLAANRMPPKRTYTRKPGARLEKHVLAEVMDALRRDPRVALVERQQSGVFVEGNRHIRVGTPGALDIKGMLHGGRMFEIEAKAPGKKPDERQQRRIDALRANGAIAGFATSAEEALALLP